MTTCKIVVVDLRAYRVERVDSGGFKSVRSFATYKEARLCVDQDRNFETNAALAKRAELRRLAAALTVRATAARKRAEAAVERSARTRGLVAQACQHVDRMRQFTRFRPIESGNRRHRPTEPSPIQSSSARALAPPTQRHRPN